jgi:hypothetical protein
MPRVTAIKINRIRKVSLTTSQPTSVRFTSRRHGNRDRPTPYKATVGFFTDGHGRAALAACFPA